MSKATKKDLRHSALSTMYALGMKPDPWQLGVLISGHRRLLLNCSRQAGKSTAVAVLCVLETIRKAGTRVLILAPSARQAGLLFKQVAKYLGKIREEFIEHETIQELDLKNDSQVICLPCKEETIRGYSNVDLLVIDEAARVPDDVYRAVCPMLAVSNGRMVCLSTPFGRRGFFYEQWAKGDERWQRIRVPVEQVPRISKQYQEEVRRDTSESFFRQEFCCSFEALEGLIYPDLEECVVQAEPPEGRWYGGIDFGLRNPFAAVWGVLDRDDVFWVTNEYYMRDKSLVFHARHLPRHVTWYADPSGAQEIKELHCAGLAVRKAINKRRPGIFAVRARIETGRLKILNGACPNLLAEAARYQGNPDAEGGGADDKADDHALDALRYLFSRLDQKRMAYVRARPQPNVAPPVAGGGQPLAEPPSRPERKWLSVYNEALWTRIY